MSESEKRVFVVMGVSGSGKSVIATEAARAVEGAMLDGDYLHPRTNIQKMSSGQALNDDDRAPWLAALNDAAFAMKRTNLYSFIVCSALKKRYRDRLRAGNPEMRFLYLKGDFDLIESRMSARKGHFFKPRMLATQFETLEEPGEDEEDVWVIPIHGTIEEVVAEVVGRIREECGPVGER